MWVKQSDSWWAHQEPQWCKRSGTLLLLVPKVLTYSAGLAFLAAQVNATFTPHGITLELPDESSLRQSGARSVY